MDFRVYHYGARGVFDGTRPVYGLTSGLGWPMHYRYPPLFLLLFAPLAALPLGFAAAVWVVAKIAALVWLIWAIKKRGIRPSPTLAGAVISILFIGPYIVEEFRYGNAQFFVIALTLAALLTLRERPLLAGISLGLAISIKVWPVFFLPYLAVRRDWKPVIYTMGVIVFLSFLPTLYFGLSENVHLLGQWFDQEFRTQLSESEIWFPSQSLRGVLMRYFTMVDYSKVPDSNYASVNIAAVDPGTVRWLWATIAVGTYAAFLWVANRHRNSDGWLDHAVAFCLIALLEPFTQKYALSMLLLPAIVAAGLMKKNPFRILMYAAVVLVLIQPLAPGASAQRLLQVLGLDFVATVMLTTALALAWFKVCE